MKIDVQIRVNEQEILDGTAREIASAWVEIEESIKFPVKVRTYLDKKENKEKFFVSYPQRKTGKGYENVLYPSDRSIREEINQRVLESMREKVLKGVGNPPVTDVRVTLLENRQPSSAVVLRALASIKVVGITINGIMVKEGKNGLFVQMPQHKSNGEYRDTVYGTSAGMQADIRNEVLYAYERELEKQQKPDQAEQRKALETEEEDQQKEGIQAPELPENHPAEKNQAQELQEEQRKEQEGVREPAGNQQEESPQALEPAESIKLFFAAHEKGNLPKMLDIVKNANVDVDRLVTYVKNGTEIESQYASIISGEDMLVFRFLNNYGHLQEEMPAEPLSQRIEAILYKNGKNAGVQTLYERYSRNGADALENYQEMEGYWKKLTKQGSIQPEKTRGQEKRPVREPAVSAQAPKI